MLGLFHSFYSGLAVSVHRHLWSAVDVGYVIPVPSGTTVHKYSEYSCLAPNSELFTVRDGWRGQKNRGGGDSLICHLQQGPCLSGPLRVWGGLKAGQEKYWMKSNKLVPRSHQKSHIINSDYSFFVILNINLKKFASGLRKINKLWSYMQ